MCGEVSAVSGVGSLGTACSFRDHLSSRGGHSRECWLNALAYLGGPLADAVLVCGICALLLFGSVLFWCAAWLLFARFKVSVSEESFLEKMLRLSSRGCRRASGRRLCSARHSPGQGINRRSTRLRRVRVEPPKLLAGVITCPCFLLPEGRRGASSSSQGAAFQLGRRRREVWRRELAARAGTRRVPRVRVFSAEAVGESVSVRRTRKPRVFKARPVWDAVAFDARLGMEDWALGDRKVGMAAFMETLPALSPCCLHAQGRR